MTKIRVTKEFNFEIAHALWNYNGPCANIHGHSYRLFVTVIGYPIIDDKNPKLGMIIDFADLKRIVNEEIIKPFDHAFIISERASKSLNYSQNQMFEKQIVVKYQPTCENMVIDFVQKIKKSLPPDLFLYSLKLHETATSFAEWFASDND